jgi:hypothetical protein
LRYTQIIEFHLYAAKLWMLVFTDSIHNIDLRTGGDTHFLNALGPKDLAAPAEAVYCCLRCKKNAEFDVTVFEDFGRLFYLAGTREEDGLTIGLAEGLQQVEFFEEVRAEVGCGEFCLDEDALLQHGTGEPACAVGGEAITE